MFHIALHFAVPLMIAGLFFKKQWQMAYFIMMATMLIDLDHLLADSIYDPNRCSIGFHPLHQMWSIVLYFVMCWIPKTRLLGIGLTVHMVLDAIDCF
jgi:hypothetical protein